MCSSSALFSLCGFRAFFLSLFFKSYYKGEDGKKNEERKKERVFAFVLKPYTLNSFFFKFNYELIDFSCKIESCVNVDIIHTLRE